MTKVEKELSVLMLATSFIKMYLDDVVKEKSDVVKYEKVLKLVGKLQKMCMLYSKKAEQIISKSIPILEQIEAESKTTKPLKRFEKKVRFSDNNIDVNGLLFGTALLLEHGNMKNRVLKFDYKPIRELYSNFDGRTSKTITNSRALSAKYIDKLKEDK